MLGNRGVMAKSVEVVADNRGESRCIALEGFNRGLKQIHAVRGFPSYVIAARVGQMANELALGPAVAFAEGMKGVQFAEIVRGAVTKGGAVESGEMLFLRKLLEDRRGGRLDMGVMGEQVAALADVDGSQLSGPFVHVTE